MNIAKESENINKIPENNKEEQSKNHTLSFKIKSKEEITEVPKADYEVYKFKDSGSGKSWLIGTDIFTLSNKYDYANAFRNGITACPEYLEIPRTLTNSSGITLPVEIIGRGAFWSCGREKDNGKTKRLKVTRQVKAIKVYGLGSMYDLEAFEIEAGSQLETIEDVSMHQIGTSTVRNDPSKRNGTLILPSTLSSVGRNGITFCNLFHTIIYCGSHLLTNNSDLEDSDFSDPVVKVTNQYPSNKKIFERNPDRRNPLATEVTCRIMSGDLSYSLPNLLSLCSSSTKKEISSILTFVFLIDRC